MVARQKMSMLEQHPLCAVFPPMTPAEFKDLKASIKKNGQREPITVIDVGGRMMILEGWHRYRVCTELKIKPVFEDKPFEGSDQEVKDFVIDKNKNRRHLTVAQRAKIAVEIAKIKIGRPSDKRGGATPLTEGEGTTLKDTAEKMNVSYRTAKDMNAVKERGGKALNNAVEQEEIGIQTAADIARTVPKSEQKEAVDEAIEKKEEAKKKKPQQKEPEEKFNTYDLAFVHTDFETKGQLMNDLRGCRIKRGHFAFLRGLPGDHEQLTALAEDWGLHVLSVILVKRTKKVADNVTMNDYDLCLICNSNDGAEIPVKHRPSQVMSEENFKKLLDVLKGRSNVVMGSAQLEDATKE